MVSTELKRANPNTIQDKVLVGYQGWFTCAGDGPPLDPGHHGWLHWFNFPIPNGGRPNTDIWPDTSDYDPSELYPAPGLATASGDPVHLFSSRHPKTVQRHFHWMARHGVDGAFLQRFAGQCEIKSGNIAIRDLRDEIGDRVREAAEAEGRVFAIMYDVSGVSPDKIQNILEQDWTHLLRDKHILDSPNYLRENGRPVVALWGFGLNGRNHTPELVRAITGFFRSFTPGGVYLVAGTPGHWRTSSSDADRNPEFVQVWTDCFDAISPWTVGRYGNEEEADQWGQGRLKVDAEYLKNMETQGGRKVDYIPVVLPGGSGFNLSEGKWRMNDMRRHGGRFLWRQIYNAKCAGVRTIYGAMWDEYDEGTAFMPVVPHASQLPVHPSFRFLALDVDGHDLPSDWYMRIAGFAAEAFHGERTLPDTLPVKELQDYWSSRPRYEGGGKINDKQAADVDGVTRAVGAWGISEGNVQMNVPTDAPPPYSLEDTPAQQAPPGGVRPPPVRQDTRPSSSQAHSPAMLAAGAAAAAVSAGIAAHALSARSGNAASGGAMPRPTPPPVNMSARPPPPPTRPSCRASSEMGMPIGPPAALRPISPPGAQVGYDPGRQAYEHGRVPSIGRGGMGFPAPVGPPPMGPPPMGVDYGRGRGRSRSRSKSRSKSRSRSRTRKYKLKDRRSRSRSRSSSGSRRGDRLPVHSVHQSLHRHGQSFGHGHGRGPGVHGHGLVHTQSLPPVGSPHAMAFPGAGAGAGTYDAYAGGGGGYAPVHSHPVGYGGPGASGPGYAPGQGQQGYAPGQGQGQQGYTPGQGQGQQGYAQGQGPVPHAAYGRYASPPPQGGYGPGPGYGQGQGQQGQGYDAMGSPQQPQGYGYTSHPSSGYSSYGGAGPYPGGSGSGGGGGGGIQAGIATALQKVEGIAGPQTRMQLERTVKSLTNTGSSLFNKFK